MSFHRRCPMSKPTLDHFRPTRDSRDAERYLLFRGAKPAGQCGSHVKYRAPSGAQIIFPDKRDLPKGTVGSIVKMILIAGLGVVVVACSYLAMITA